MFGKKRSREKGGGKKKNQKNKEDDIPHKGTPSVGYLTARNFYNQHTISRLSGANPVSFKAEESERFILFDKLRRFYAQYDAVAITTGLGQIVDWTMKNGVEKLNQRLLIKYGETLDSLLEEEEKREQAEKQSEDQNSNPSNSTRSDTAEVQENLIGSPGMSTPIRAQLMTFYKLNDQEKLANGVDDDIQFLKENGIDSLNERLKEEYGVCLEVHGESLPAEPERKNTLSDKKKTDSRGAKASSRKTKAASKNPKSEKKKSHPTKSKTQVVESPVIRKRDLPVHVKPMLQLFFAVYDPYKLESGYVREVYQWTQKHGVEILSAKLGQKYGEGFNDFVKRSKLLEGELVAFYNIADPNRLVDGIDKILRWSLRNGRGALNSALVDKYGYGLDFKKVVPEIEEPDF